MAGIQVPTLGRVNAVPDEGPAPRIDAKVPNAAPGMAQQTAAFSQLGDQAIKYEDKVASDAADTESTKRAAQYEIEYRKKLYGDGTNVGIKFQEGDPTQLYNKLDTEMGDVFKNLSADDSLPERTRTMVTKKLVDKQNSLQLNRLSEWGNQQARYEEGVTNSAISLEKSNRTDATAYIKGDDPTTLSAFDAAVGRIRDLRIKHAMKMGGVRPDEKGQAMVVGDDGKPIRVALNPEVQADLQKDLSDGIYNAMDNLVKAGQLTSAKALQDKYMDYLEPLKRKSYMDDFRKADIKGQAFDAVRAVNPNDPSSVEKTFGKLEPEVAEQARKVLDDQERYKKNLIDRASKTNHDSLSNMIAKRQRSDSPFNGPTELEADPTFRNQINKVTDAKQRQALYNMVEQPKETAQATTVKIQDFFAGNDPNHPDPRSTSSADFQLIMSGASKADRSRWQRKYEALSTETGAQQATRYKAIDKALQDQLLVTSYISRDAGGKIRGDDETKLTMARDEMHQFLDKNDHVMQPKEIDDWARNFAISKAKGEAFKPPVVQKFQGSRNVVAPVNGQVAPPPGGGTPPVDAAGNQMIKGKTKMGWVKAFQADPKNNGRLPNINNGELQKFIDNQD